MINFGNASRFDSVIENINLLLLSGHSVGELGCAYADGCVTTEEMILSAYYRGLVSLETEFIHGSMAAVGMGYQEVNIINFKKSRKYSHSTFDQYWKIPFSR